MFIVKDLNTGLGRTAPRRDYVLYTATAASTASLLSCGSGSSGRP